MTRRLLLCNYEYPPLGGGGGTACRAIAIEMARRGWHVEILTAAFKHLPRRVVGDNIVMHRVRCLRRDAGQCRPYEMVSWVASALPWRLLRSLTWSMPRPDAVMSFHSIPSGMAGAPLARWWGVPHIVRFGGGDVPGWLPGELAGYHRLSNSINQRIVRGAAAVLANSEGLKEMARRAFPGVRIDILCNAINPNEFPPPSPRKTDRAVRFVFAGRMTSQKGLDTLMKALARMHRNSPKLAWQIELIGEGPLRQAVSDMAHSHGFADRVKLPGWLSREAVHERLRAADIFVLPSRYEGMPNALLEAMACSLPAVATDIMGSSELVIDRETGFLVRPDDDVALADRLERLARDPRNRKLMGDRARKWAFKEWTWQRRGDELEELFARVGVGRRRR